MGDPMKDPALLLSHVESDVLPFRAEPFPPFLQWAASNLTTTLLKKWSVRDKKDVRAEAKAAQTFLEANHLSKGWKWRSGDQVQEELFGLLKHELDTFFHPRGSMLFSSYEQLLEEGRTGPGSALAADGQSFYAKLGSSPQLSVTSLDLYILYRAYLNRFPLWDEGESLRQSQNEASVRIVDASRMTFVPKNVDTDRAICVEPSLNMFMQLGLEGVMRSRILNLWNIDLETQPDINRILARIGSRDGSFATLDLSSASDLISVELCRTVLPTWVFDTLMELRVPSTCLPSFGLKVDLGMISTMGNGFTFPLMTTILGCAIRSVYRYLGVPIRDNPKTQRDGVLTPGNWAVFGDDLIVCREAYDLLVSFLHNLGLSVNLAKSFNTGPFRESCGHDYYCGRDVRGVYLKRLTSRQDIAVAVNLLNDWSFRTGIPLRASVKYLLEGLDLPYVPYADNLDAGIRVPSSVFRGTMKKQKWAYKAFLQRPKSYHIGDGVITAPRRGRRWFYNGPMLLLSLLKGELRNGKISVRHNENLYHTRWRVTPWWDYMPMSVWVNPRTDWRRWSTAVEQNMLDLVA